MAQYLNPSGVTLTPPPRGVYVVSFIDVPGVVASNNFLSFLNPKNSGILHQVLEFRCNCYSMAASGTPNSLAAYRITSQSGGSVFDNSQANRAVTGMPDPLTQIITGNPTVSRLNNTPLLFKEPPISVGVGGAASQLLISPSNASCLQGEGMVLNTAAGNTNQLWNFTYIFAEYILPVR